MDKGAFTVDEIEHSGDPDRLTIIRQQGDSHQFTLTDRDAYTGVVAHWLNTRHAQPETVSVRRKRKKRPPTHKSRVTI